MSPCKAGKQSCAANVTPGPAPNPWGGVNVPERQDVHVLPTGYATGQVAGIKAPVHRILSSFLSDSSCLEHTFPSAHRDVRLNEARSAALESPEVQHKEPREASLIHQQVPGVITTRRFHTRCNRIGISAISRPKPASLYELLRFGFHRRSNRMTGKSGQCSRNLASGSARRARLMWSVRWCRPGALQLSAASVVLRTVQEVEHEKAYDNRTDRSEAGIGCQHNQPDSGPVAYAGSNTREEEACHEERDCQRKEGDLHDENDHILPHPCRRHMPISLLALCSAPRSTSLFPWPCTARRRRGTRRHLAPLRGSSIELFFSAGGKSLFHLFLFSETGRQFSRAVPPDSARGVASLCRCLRRR